MSVAARAIQCCIAIVPGRRRRAEPAPRAPQPSRGCAFRSGSSRPCSSRGRSRHVVFAIWRSPWTSVGVIGGRSAPTTGAVALEQRPPRRSLHVSRRGVHAAGFADPAECARVRRHQRPTARSGQASTPLRRGWPMRGAGWGVGGLDISPEQADGITAGPSTRVETTDGPILIPLRADLAGVSSSIRSASAGFWLDCCCRCRSCTCHGGREGGGDCGAGSVRRAGMTCGGNWGPGARSVGGGGAQRRANRISSQRTSSPSLGNMVWRFVLLPLPCPKWG